MHCVLSEVLRVIGQRKMIEVAKIHVYNLRRPTTAAVV